MENLNIQDIAMCIIYPIFGWIIMALVLSLGKPPTDFYNPYIPITGVVLSLIAVFISKNSSIL